MRDNDVVKARYAGWTRCESVPFNVAIGMAVSHDEETFVKAGPGPAIGYSPDEPFVMMGQKFADSITSGSFLYRRAQMEVGGWPRRAGLQDHMATSDDGINWTKLNKSDPQPYRRGRGAGQPGCLLRQWQIPYVLLLPLQRPLSRKAERLPHRLRVESGYDHVASG